MREQTPPPAVPPTQYCRDEQQRREHRPMRDEEDGEDPADQRQLRISPGHGIGDRGRALRVAGAEAFRTGGIAVEQAAFNGLQLPTLTITEHGNPPTRSVGRARNIWSGA